MPASGSHDRTSPVAARSRSRAARTQCPATCCTARTAVRSGSRAACSRARAVPRRPPNRARRRPGRTGRRTPPPARSAAIDIRARRAIRHRDTSATLRAPAVRSPGPSSNTAPAVSDRSICVGAVSQSIVRRPPRVVAEPGRKEVVDRRHQHLVAWRCAVAAWVPDRVATERLREGVVDDGAVARARARDRTRGRSRRTPSDPNRGRSTARCRSRARPSPRRAAPPRASPASTYGSRIGATTSNQ